MLEDGWPSNDRTVVSCGGMGSIPVASIVLTNAFAGALLSSKPGNARRWPTSAPGVLLANARQQLLCWSTARQGATSERSSDGREPVLFLSECR